MREYSLSAGWLFRFVLECLQFMSPSGGCLIECVLSSFRRGIYSSGVNIISCIILLISRYVQIPELDCIVSEITLSVGKKGQK